MVEGKRSRSRDKRGGHGAGIDVGNDAGERRKDGRELTMRMATTQVRRGLLRA